MAVSQETASGATPAVRRRFGLLVSGVALLGVVLLTRAVAIGRTDARATHLAARRAATTSLSGVHVVDPAGREYTITPEGGGVVMLVASTCGHCHHLLTQMAQVAAGRRAPHLRVVALDGAAAGQHLLDSLGLAAAATGPADLAQLQERIHVRGTPLLLRVGANGAVADAVLGDLTESEVRVWSARAF